MFGRNAENVDTVLQGSVVSRVHAAMEWNGQGWYLRDLGRNGTWLGKKRLPPNSQVTVTAGDEIRFGNPEGAAWKMLDDSEPRSQLIALNPGGADLNLAAITLLPNEEQPEIVLTRDPERQCWTMMRAADEPGADAAELAHGDTVECGGGRWRLFIAESGVETQFYPLREAPLSDYEFVFNLSLDEENTVLQLQRPEQVVDLGDRSHHYLLMHLARRRAEQAQAGIDRRSQGWIETEVLAQELGVERAHLNILVHRARKQVSDLVTHGLDPDLLVERMQGRMRFGCEKFRIYKGEALAYQMSEPAPAPR